MKFFNLFCLLLLLIAGCSSSQNSEEDIGKLKRAPAELGLDGKTFTLDAYIWRDLMPSSDPKVKRGLIASVRIISSDGSEIPAELKVLKLFILNNNSVWETKPDELNSIAPGMLEIKASGGPEWEINTKVDIVVKINYSKKTKLLGLKNQEVHAVY